MLTRSIESNDIPAAPKVSRKPHLTSINRGPTNDSVTVPTNGTTNGYGHTLNGATKPQQNPAHTNPLAAGVAQVY